MSTDTGWIQIPDMAQASLPAEFSQQLALRVEQRVASGQIRPEELQYVKDLNLSVGQRGLAISDKQLEKLRLACQLFDVDLRTREISSHRKFIGPIIVAAKKALFPIIRVFLKDFLHQQRSFNAAVIDALTELCAEKPGAENSCLRNPCADDPGAKESA